MNAQKKAHRLRRGFLGVKTEQAQKKFYSGKKKKHTLKAQIVINQKNKKILCTAYGKGKEHDFSLLKTSKTCRIEKIRCLGDKGYQGIKKLHKASQTPHKNPRKKELSQKQKKENRDLASLRIVIEHVYRSLKVFKILSERYRNRRKSAPPALRFPQRLGRSKQIFSSF